MRRSNRNSKQPVRECTTPSKKASGKSRKKTKAAPKEKLAKKKVTTVGETQQVLSKKNTPSKKRKAEDLKDRDKTIGEIIDDVKNNMTLFGNESETVGIRKETEVTKRYSDAKDKRLVNFFTIVANNESLNFMTRLNKDKKEVFWDVFVAKNSPKHKYLLNICIIVWGQSLIMRGYANVDIKSLPPAERAKEEFQPNSIETYHKQLCSSFRFRGIAYLQ